MDLRLRERTVLVTGGSSGVGMATVRELLAEGANVVTCARRADVLDEAIAELGADPARVLAMPCDVLDADQVAALVRVAEQRFGGLDGLVNNAGQSRMKPFAETTDEDWTDELRLKFFGVLNPLRAALPLLRKSAQAAVVNVNAVLGKQPEPRLITTSAARAGVLNLATSLATELAADGIRVNSVCLGVVDTGQWRRRYEQSGSTQSYVDWQAGLAADRGIALGRFGTAEEVASVIAMLLSPRSSYVTGAALDVCGGAARYAF